MATGSIDLRIRVQVKLHPTLRRPLWLRLLARLERWVRDFRAASEERWVRRLVARQGERLS